MAINPIREPLLDLQNISKNFGIQQLFNAVALTIHDGDRIGLIGRNGSGKSTLLRIMAGLEPPDEGTVTRKLGLRIAMLSQQCRLASDLTIEQVLHHSARETQNILDEYHRLAHEMADTPEDDPRHAGLGERFAAVHHQAELADAWHLQKHIKEVTVALGLPPPDRRLDGLSGGELRRVDLAATLLQRPDLLLLDEPTNHVDTKTVEWVESFLASYPGACVLVTHDRYFLDLIVNRIVEVELGALLSFPGDYEQFLDYKANLQETAARTETRRRAILRHELAWLKRGAQARTGKQKARIQRYDELSAAEPVVVQDPALFRIPQPHRLGKRILEVENLSKSYGDRTLFSGLFFKLQQGMRVGIIGPNGCGKTTLLRVLMGQEPPDKGTVHIGETTQFLYVDQSHETINPNHTIMQHVSNGAEFMDVEDVHVHVPSYLARFLFDREALYMPMLNLSGGERNRIDLAKKLLQGGNVLVLDEPTNDLDLATLRLLEDAVKSFDGCVLIVSHDRYFLNRVCTHVLAFNEDARITQLAGGYDDYLAWSREQAQVQAEQTTETTNIKPERSVREKRTRLSWKEQKELENIENTIIEAESKLEQLENAVTAQDFYRGDHQTVQQTLTNLDAARKRVEQLYERWQQLEQH